MIQGLQFPDTETLFALAIPDRCHPFAPYIRDLFFPLEEEVTFRFRRFSIYRRNDQGLLQLQGTFAELARLRDSTETPYFFAIPNNVSPFNPVLLG